MLVSLGLAIAALGTAVIVDRWIRRDAPRPARPAQWYVPGVLLTRLRTRRRG